MKEQYEPLELEVVEFDGGIKERVCHEDFRPDRRHTDLAADRLRL